MSRVGGRVRGEGRAEVDPIFDFVNFDFFVFSKFH